MATKLFKLKVEAETTTTVTANPLVDLYFYEVDDAHRVGNDLEIPADAFTDKDGNAVTTINLAEDGYYSLYINGVQQQDALFEVAATDLTIFQATDILTGTPIVFVVTNFEPTANSTTTVET